jgi:hypothetical protein
LALVGLLTLFSAEHQPTYKGRSLEHWLKVYGSPESYGKGAGAEAEEALRSIGTNAVPFLLKWVAYETHPSRSKQFAITAISMLPLLKNHPWVKRWMNSTDSRLFRADVALAAFEVLGPSASFAIPQLASMAHGSTNPGPARRAVDALANIGPPAFQAVLGVVADPHADARFYAITALQSFGTNARPAIPILIASLTNTALASAASETLGHLKLETQLVVPALIEIAQTSDPISQSWAISTISAFGTNALAAVPVLLPALSSTNALVRDAATNALLEIAPEVITNTPR